MKYLITTIAALVLVGCGESDHQHSNDHGHSHAEGDHDHAESDGHDHDKELKAAETATLEPPTAKAPGIYIHGAARDKNIEDIKKYLAAGGDVNAKGGFGTTPLHMAAQHFEDVDGAKLLIAGGADVNAKDNFGNTPLDMVNEVFVRNGKIVSRKESESYKLLRKHGAKTSEELKAEGK